MSLYMTAYGGSIIGPIAKLFGIIINALYNFFEVVCGIENVNIGFIIIVFTIIVYLILLPLTYKQQKFSVLQRKIQPELKEIQARYKGKKDQASMMKQQEETQALYDKYGISMVGSCGQLIIQLPIIYALFGVFNNLPAYIDKIRNIFSDVVTNVQADPDYLNKMNAVYESMGNAGKRIRVDFLGDGHTASELANYIIDVSYKLSEAGWDVMRENFSGFADVITKAQTDLGNVNYFFLLNISDTPLNIIKNGWETKNFLLLFIALLIPVFSYTSQVLSLKLSMANTDTASSGDQMATQMQTMNKIMPLISLIFVFSVPVGLGLYWIASAVFRAVSSIFLNKHFEKIDVEKIIEKNKEKAKAKAIKRKERTENMTAAATMRTRKTMSEKANIGNEAEGRIEEANELRVNARPGSMASKANLVAEFNRKNSRK